MSEDREIVSQTINALMGALKEAVKPEEIIKISELIFRALEMAGSKKEGLLDINDVAEYMKVSVSFLRKSLSEMKLPYVKIKSMVRFEAQSLRDWVVKRVRKAHPVWK